jgi:sulfoxide reductase heme-binding subunit YedZ
MKRTQYNLVQLALHLAALVPLALLSWDYSQDNLTFNPIQEITHRTGYAAIVLLVLSLACTPINTLLGIKRVIAFRRPLGLYAFGYAALHLLTFVVLDYGLDWNLIQQAVAEKRYVLVGLAAFLLLLPLAITSTKGWMRRMGKNWKRLHWLVYAAAPLAVLHYLLLVKADYRQPVLFGAIVALLLVFRLGPVRNAARAFRSRLSPPKAARLPNDVSSP